MSSISEKKFVIKHVFTSFDKLPDGETFGNEQNHFGLIWKIRIFKNPRFASLVLYLCCNKPNFTRVWSTEVECKLKKMEEGQQKLIKKNLKFPITHVYDRIHTVENIRDLLVDVTVTVEFQVKIIKTSGLTMNISMMKKLRNFDESNQKFSDVVLVVEDQKFYVSKLFIASVSTYFEALLLGNFDESKQSEVELKEIDAWDFQKFLECIHGESAIEEDNVADILKLADFFDSKYAIKRCEEFLLNVSERPFEQKFEIAMKYQLKDLTEKCISEMKTSEDIRSIVPEDASNIKDVIWKELLLKSLSLNK